MLLKKTKKVLIVICLLLQIKLTAQSIVLCIEGNIGVGKTTFLKVLSKVLPQAAMVSEPVDEWQDISGYNLLGAFYKDGARWACTFQLYALMTRIRKQQLYAQAGCKMQILERSWFSDRYCFATNCFLLGMLNEMEWKMYCDIWDWHASNAVKPTAIIYLRTEPEVCYERMKSRSRNEEALVPLDYLKMLHDRHEEWLVQGKYCKDLFANIPVLILDGSDNFKDDEGVQKEFVQQILDFLKKHESIDFTM